MKWIIGCDHAGLPLKQVLHAELLTWHDEVVDVGTHDTSSVDYPVFGHRVASAVVAEPGTLGIVVCGSGIGISIAANRVVGARCALVQDAYAAALARQHNDANVIALGARLIGPGAAIAAVRAFRDTAFEGGRHARRVAMLDEMDRP